MTLPSTPSVSRGNLSWYAKRLRVMGPAELCHRVYELCNLKLLEVQHRFGGPPARFTPHDAAGFAFCSGSRAQLPNLPWVFEPDETITESLLAGKLLVLGHAWTWNPQSSVWHEAPDTHQQWPQRFFGRIPYRPGNSYGDVRIAWEPSRLQHLAAIGLFAQQAEPQDRERAVALVENQLLSWVTANPYLTGIHYISAMECGLRLLAVCHAVDLVREWLQKPHILWPALLGLVQGHAELIRRRLSVHSSRGNHTVAESAALIYAGSLFPEMQRASLWRSLGLSVLEQEASHQILQDGGGAEQTFWYQRFVADLYGLVCLLLRHQKQPVPSAIEEAFHRSSTFLHTFANHGSALPGIGDGDNGYALSPFLQFAKKATNPGLTTFDASGYSLIRFHSVEQDQLIFDHGPLGLAPCYAHGHADALSVILSVREQEVLVDPGTYTYNGDLLWRKYFRGTRAHNTVVVDDLDQAVQETPFMWSQPYHAALVHREETPAGMITLLARHDGYEKRAGVTHWRAILYDPSGWWLVWDCLTGEGVHQLELNWHLGIEPSMRAGLYVMQTDQGPACLGVEGGDAKLHRGEVNPIIGWRSKQYGVKEPISTLQTKYTGRLPHEFVTGIFLGNHEPLSRAVAERLSAARKIVYETKTR